MTARITPEQLIAFGFSAKRLREEGGFDAYQLRQAAFDINELKNAGFSAIQLRCAGFNAVDLKNCNFSCLEIYEAGFSHHRLKEAGFTAESMYYHLSLNISELKAAGFSASDLKSIFALEELKVAGFTASEVVRAFTPAELVRIGYVKDELKPLGAWPHDGHWQTYNQYWDCCFNLDKHSECCGVTRPAKSGSHDLHRSSST